MLDTLGRALDRGVPVLSEKALYKVESRKFSLCGSITVSATLLIYEYILSIAD